MNIPVVAEQIVEPYNPLVFPYDNFEYSSVHAINSLFPVPPAPL